jgi:Protein of unknown function (DUF1326)
LRKCDARARRVLRILCANHHIQSFLPLQVEELIPVTADEKLLRQVRLSMTGLGHAERSADDKQTEALGAIFTGAAGGPMAALAPLIGKNLGVSKVPITFRIEGKKRSAEIPDILHMSVDPLPTAHLSGEMWANTGHRRSARRHFEGPRAAASADRR